MSNKRMLSGIKPTGELTLGNYIGAIKNFVKLQDEYELFIFIADLHALTMPQEKAELRRRIKEIAAMYIACGIDPEKTTIFIQSEIPAHPMMGYLMECTSYIGELNRMTQFKEKTKNQKNEAIRCSLYTYPALMAADILLYDPEYVPVGDDQKQHVELTRNLAQRFNNKYGDFFTIPEPISPKIGARIMDLQDPTSKMSKSDDNDKGCILLLDDINIAKKKIRSAVTDNEKSIKYDPINKPGISNLLSIYSVLSNKAILELEKEYQGVGYGDFKKALSLVVAEELTKIQTKYYEVINSNYLNEVLDKGAERANQIAMKKVYKAFNKVGLGRKRK